MFYLWTRITRAAEGQNDVHDEEGKPTDDESRHHDGHRSSGATLFRHLSTKKDKIFLKIKKLLFLSRHQKGRENGLNCVLLRKLSKNFQIQTG